MAKMHPEIIVASLAVGITALCGMTLSWNAFWRWVERRARLVEGALEKPDPRA